MSADLTVESSDLKKFPLEEVVEDIHPPAYDAVDPEAAIPHLAPLLEPRPLSRTKAFFITVFYTAALVITTLIFCLYGSLAIGFPYDERSAMLQRVTYASILGGVILGPIYFASKRFTTFTRTKHEIINVRIANGRLFGALGHSILLCAVLIGVVASAASLGYGLIFRPLVYSDDVSVGKMVLDAVLVPVACLIGGLRWVYELLNISMWILVRIPKISTGLEGKEHDRLMKITIVFTIFRLMTEGVSATLPLCILFFRQGLMDKCVAYYDKYRESTVEVAGPQPNH